VLRGGDVLVAEDGSLVRVLAAPQPVLVHHALRGTAPPFDLTRAAYHLGNRHVPLELQPDHLQIEPDHVLADMLRAMHLIVTEDAGAFEPEGGAYAAGIGSRAWPRTTITIMTTTTGTTMTATATESRPDARSRAAAHVARLAGPAGGRLQLLRGAGSGGRRWAARS
jgi:hypothetical protein